MRITLAWHNVWANGRRLIAAVAGISFAVLLVFVQIGVIDSLRRASTLVYDALEFDLILVSSHYQYLNRAEQFPTNHLAQVRVIPEVAQVAKLNYSLARWDNYASGSRTGVMLLGIEPEAALFRDPQIIAGLKQLRTRDQVLIDDYSTLALGPIPTGKTAHLNGHEVTLEARFQMGMRFYSQGAVIASPETYAKIVPGRRDTATFGLIRLRPGADANPVVARLGQILPKEVKVFRRAEFLRLEKDHYTTEMPLGIVTQLGIFISLLLGAVVTSQVISSDFSTRLTEYATLKATGFSSGFVYSVGLLQATFLAVLAYLPSLALANLVYRVAWEVSCLPMTMSWWIALLVFALTMIMSLVAGIAALRTVQHVDPAELM